MWAGRVWVAAVLGMLGLVWAGTGTTQAVAQEARLLQIGPAPLVDAARVPGVSVLTLPGLPDPEAARGAFLSTVLRSNLVSTLLAGPQDLGGMTGQLFLALEARIGQVAPQEGRAPGDDGGLTVEVAGAVHPVAQFADRLRAMVDAVAPLHRQVALFRLSDPDNLFASHVATFQQAVSASGFALVVAEVGPRSPDCATGIDPLLALVAGLADRIPFGDADGQTSVSEASDWLTDTLARPGRRLAACRDTYAVIVQSAATAAQPVAQTVAGALTRDVETSLYRESFEAKFLLGSEDAGKLGNYLDSCVFCPSERDLTARLDRLRQIEVTASMEAAIWGDIRNDVTPERLQIYLSNCQLCAMRTEAEAMVAAMAAADAAREAEAIEFRRSAATQDLAALRRYDKECVACAFRDEAAALVARVEADDAYRAEAVALDAALAAQDPAALEEWLRACATCDRKDLAVGELARLTAAQVLVTPCLAAAGVPQAGGPRSLADIVPRVARRACAAAQAQLPRDLRLQVAAARIDQAEGRIDAAQAVYDQAAAAGLSEAYGLAAFVRFSPPPGRAPDHEAAAALARSGAALGDWLSRELLIQIHSRQLITGADPAEALPLARDLADQGSVVGQFYLGYFLQTGIGAERDEAQALVWLQRALDGGFVRAGPFLAEILEAGRVTPSDPGRAAALLWAALEAGDSVALTRLTDQLGDRPAEVIRDIQQRLRDSGVYSGRIDGLNGPGTARAVRVLAESLPQKG